MSGIISIKLPNIELTISPEELVNLKNEEPEIYHLIINLLKSFNKNS